MLGVAGLGIIGLAFAVAIGIAIGVSSVPLVARLVTAALFVLAGGFVLLAAEPGSVVAALAGYGGIVVGLAMAVASVVRKTRSEQGV